MESVSGVLESQGIPVIGGGPETPQQVAPARTLLAKRSFMFGDLESAERFQASMQTAYGGSGLSAARDVWGLYNEAPEMAREYGGQLFRSTYGRETKVYGYQQLIYETDREYLFARDTTAGMLVEQYNKVWNGMPQTFIPEVDAYLSQQVTLGLLIAFQAGYQEYWQEGGSFIYCETTGDPIKRISRGERPVAWTFLPAHCIVQDMKDPLHAPLLAQKGNVDPLLDHGFEEISFYPTMESRATNEPLRVHGSRLIPINLDPRKQKWWRTNHIPLNRTYDTLWELRDVIFSRVRSIFQGDPIVVDVDISEEAQRLLNIANLNETQKTAMSQAVEQAVVDYNTGAKSTFAPVMGFKLRRLGAAQIPDPKEDVMMLSSRLAHGSLYPVKFILASTKGNSDVSDQDLLILQGNVQDVRNVWGYKHIAKVVLMGQVMGANGLRMQGEHDLPHSRDMEWPLLRPLSPRDAAFTEKTDASIARELQEASLVMPARLRRKYPEDTRRPKPLWLAARGRDMDGKSMDPKSAAGGEGGAGASSPSTGPRADADYQAWLEGKDLKRKPASGGDDEDDEAPKRKKEPAQDDAHRKP